MSDIRLPQVFHLKRGEELLAVLENCQPSGEMFWVTCDFKPTHLFSEIAFHFQEASKAEDDVDLFEYHYAQLRDIGVFLLDVQNNKKIEFYVLHIEDERVVLRY